MFLRIMAVLLGLIGLLGVVLALAGLQHPAPPAAVASAPVAEAPPPAAQDSISILVAAHALHAGNLLSADDLLAMQVAPGAATSGSFADTAANRSNLRGAMVRQSIAANQTILADQILNPGDRGFLAAVLGAGMRAVSVGVDNISGTAGLIWPGDRVDLVLTQQIDDRDQPAERRVSGETVLTDMRVIAVDQQMVQGGSGPAPVANTNRTITIEATPYDAERISVASRLGRLSLTVRSATQSTPASPESGVASEQPPVAWAGDVSPALRNGKGGSGGSVRIYRGGAAADEVRF